MSVAQGLSADSSVKLCFVTQGLTLFVLLGVLLLGLLPALLAGLLAYFLIESGAVRLVKAGAPPLASRIIVAFGAASIFISVLAFGAALSASYITDGPGSVVTLLQKMADVVDTARDHLPPWVQAYFPANFQEWQVAASDWLRENARNLGEIGRDFGVFVVRVLIGLVIGGMIAVSPGFQDVLGPLAQALRERIVFLGNSFRRIVFSQIRISALNTILTAIFLAGVMPMIGSPLPLTKTMIAVTFVVGLLPVIGNLISNTVIFLIALSVSPGAAAGALAYLVGIHKLEYFLNARIIGARIRARAWEILIAMVVMEAAFGVVGVVAAPIYYAWLKDELSAKKLI